MKLIVDESWTLFLDRDGVINEKIENDYVKNWGEFFFIKGSIKAISKLCNIFQTIIIVTNQRGVGKGLMTESDLLSIHERLKDTVSSNLGRIDSIYYCTDKLDDSEFRKPNIGMGLRAKIDFPNIDFDRAIMVGDSYSDMEFAKRLGMKRVYISPKDQILDSCIFDFQFKSLYDFSISFNQNL